MHSEQDLYEVKASNGIHGDARTETPLAMQVEVLEQEVIIHLGGQGQQEQDQPKIMGLDLLYAALNSAGLEKHPAYLIARQGGTIGEDGKPKYGDVIYSWASLHTIISAGQATHYVTTLTYPTSNALDQLSTNVSLARLTGNELLKIEENLPKSCVLSIRELGEPTYEVLKESLASTNTRSKQAGKQIGASPTDILGLWPKTASRGKGIYNDEVAWRFNNPVHEPDSVQFHFGQILEEIRAYGSKVYAPTVDYLVREMIIAEMQASGESQDVFCWAAFEPRNTGLWLEQLLELELPPGVVFENGKLKSLGLPALFSRNFVRMVLAKLGLD